MSDTDDTLDTNTTNDANSPEELSPESYGDLMVEAIRTAIVSPTEVVVGFQVWDMDDFSEELTVLFRVRNYREVERIGAYPRLLRDLHAVDGQTFAVGYQGVTRVESTPTEPVKLPIVGACAITGRAADDLVVVGDGVARFDGRSWRKLDAADGGEFLCVAMHGDVVYAAGKNGSVARIDGDAVETITVPDLGEVRSIAVDDDGRLTLVGRRHVAEGPFRELAVREARAVSVARFQNRKFWGAVGDNEAMGLFAQTGAGALERVSPRMSYGLITDGTHLYGGGEFEVYRFDGEQFAVLEIAYDEDTSRWNLAPQA